MAGRAGRGDVKVSGTRELARAVDMIGHGLEVDLAVPHGKVAAVILPAARAAAPAVTGGLSGSLEVRSGPKGGRIVAGVPYGAPIHWGWAARNIAPNTFVTDAAHATESTWLDVYTDGIQDIIDRSVVASGASTPPVT